MKMGRVKEGKMIADQLLKESKEVGNHLRELDALINISWALQWFGRLDEAFQLVKKGEKLLKILFQEQQPELKGREASLLYRQGSILLAKVEFDKALNLLERSLSLREEIGDMVGVVESLSEIGWLYFHKDEPDRVLEYGHKGLKISKAIGNKKGIAISNTCIGGYYLRKGEYNRTKEYFQKSLAISEVIGDQGGLASSFHRIGRVYLHKGDILQALDYFQKAQVLYETTSHQKGLAEIHTSLGLIYAYKGELNRALEHEQTSYAISEVVGFSKMVAVSLNNIGCYYGELGDFQAATEYLERSLKVSHQNGLDKLAADTLYQLIRFFVSDLPPGSVSRYLEELKELNERHEAFPSINQRYRLAKAIVLKTQGRLEDKGTAQRIFQQVADEDIVWLELTVDALINLSELLLFELKTTGNETALKELNVLLHRLMTLAKDQNSPWLLAEAYLIQSKLKLLELDVHAARQYLTQAHIITRENGLTRLERIISIEQDSLIQQLNMWEEIIAQKPSMSDIIKLTQVNDLITRMIHKRRFHDEAELLAYAENARQLVKTWKKT